MSFSVLKTLGLMGCSGLCFGLTLGVLTPWSDRFLTPVAAADVSAPLLAQRSAQDLARYRGSVSIIYNLRESSVDLQLSAQTLADIFKGELTNWQQVHVRLPQEEIRVVTLTERSLSNLIFTRYLNRVTEGDVEASWEPTWEIPFLYATVEQEGEVASIVDRTPGAIGYVPTMIAEYYQIPTARIKDLDGTYLDRIQ